MGAFMLLAFTEDGKAYPSPMKVGKIVILGDDQDHPKVGTLLSVDLYTPGETKSLEDVWVREGEIDAAERAGVKVVR